MVVFVLGLVNVLNFGDIEPYPLVIKHSYWKWPFIVNFPFNMVIVHSYVKLPEGTFKYLLEVLSPHIWEMLRIGTFTIPCSPSQGHAVENRHLREFQNVWRIGTEECLALFQIGIYSNLGFPWHHTTVIHHYSPSLLVEPIMWEW